MTAVDIQSFKGLTHDSRQVKKGYLFAALPGAREDGRAYINDAIRNGAQAILAPRGTAIEGGKVSVIEEDNPRRAFTLLAAEFYKRQPDYIAAVTGTNGKTSTVHFAKQIWQILDRKAASIGTLGCSAVGGGGSSLTTPDPVSLHAMLADLASAGISHLGMEASSHGLDQFRLDGVKVKAAGFTNLSRDHMDYHGSMDKYLAAKMRLFTEVMASGGTAVLNADVDEFSALKQAAEKAGHKILSYGRKGKNIRILKITTQPLGQKLELEILGESYDINLPLVGEFQVMNALCALGLVIAEEESLAAQASKALEKLKGAPGRLQLVHGHPSGAAIYIDYAHTPAALENVLNALRPHVSGRLVCLFGCGGDRDKGKRPMMGEVAQRLADETIITDDNPRSEDPATIRQAILEGAPEATEIPGRRAAIVQATADLKSGDVLVIAGKGHERGQVFADHTEPFDDAEEAAKAIGELK